MNIYNDGNRDMNMKRRLLMMLFIISVCFIVITFIQIGDNKNNLMERIITKTITISSSITSQLVSTVVLRKIMHNTDTTSSYNNSVVVSRDVNRILPYSNNIGRILSIENFGAIPDSAINNKKNLEMFSEFFQQEEEDMTPRQKQNKRIALEGRRSKDSNKELNRRRRNTNSNNNVNDSNNITAVALTNMNAFNMALKEAKAGDVVLLPENESYTFFGGIRGYNLSSITLDLKGSAHFVHDLISWPFDAQNNWYYPGISIVNSTNITITCSTPISNRARTVVNMKKNDIYLDQKDPNRMGGIVNGNGKAWWDDIIFGRIHGSNDTRPRLIHVISSTNILVENITLLNSPFWTVTIEAVHAVVRNVNVLVDRKYQGQIMKEKQEMVEKEMDANGSSSNSRDDNSNNYLNNSSIVTKFPFPDDIPDWCLRKFHQPDDLNTDGIDPIGVDILIHDCIILNADDSIAVKPPPRGIHSSAYHNTIHYNCTENITIRDTVLSGFGASIGSVGPTYEHPCVNNVIFQNITMPGSGKGIYVKSNHDDCHDNVSSKITNILYEEVYIKEPFWWPIWIGPQQQHQPHTDLGGDCPLLYPLFGHTVCPTQGCATFENITLRNVTIEDPVISPGVILGNKTNPMKNVVFDNVQLTGLSKWRPLHGKWPFHELHYPYRPKYQSKNVKGSVLHNSWPIPEGLKKK